MEMSLLEMGVQLLILPTIFFLYNECHPMLVFQVCSIGTTYKQVMTSILWAAAMVNFKISPIDS